MELPPSRDPSVRFGLGQRELTELLDVSSSNQSKSSRDGDKSYILIDGFKLKSNFNRDIIT